VHAAPDDLLEIGGIGFDAGDRVVYAAALSAPTAKTHPASVPEQSGPLLGTAPIVSVADPPDSLTVRLPEVMRPQLVYHLWVVNAVGEWSEALTINDPRPLWVTPGFVHVSADPAHVGRRIRIVGRNLQPDSGQHIGIRLKGPATYFLAADFANDSPAGLQEYVAEANLPLRLSPGSYVVSVSRDGREWIDMTAQRLVVEPDPPALPSFALDEPRFGGCRPNDGALDNVCLTQAIAAAQLQGGGVIVIPPGTWDLSASQDFVLPHNVHVVGAKSGTATIVRHDAPKTRQRTALFTLSGENSIVGVTFTDADPYESPDESKAIIRLGAAASGEAAAGAVANVIITDNDFHRVGRGIEDSGRPLARLLVLRNRFAAYDRALQLPGNHFGVTAPFRIDDSVIRWNRFVPGSFIDIAGRQGTLASELGASHRVDFSDNIADGTATDGLQRPDDPKGWRAAFFWNLNSNQEELLVARNRISCPGDKAGDGEAIAFDSNGDTLALKGAPPILSADPDTIIVRSPLLGEQFNHPVDRDRFYIGHWMKIVAGPGTGQVRKVKSYVEDAATGTVTFKVEPAWDIVPQKDSRIVVGRNYWQVYTVANDVEQGNPPCTQGNLNGPNGGLIGIWASSTDSVIAANHQHDTSGIAFLMSYNYPDLSCGDCGNAVAFQSALEISGNTIDGEYDWSSDCSRSGIGGALNAAPTPQSPPPILGIGISIAHNRITRADGFRGGAIDLAATWFLGPAPGAWQLTQSLTIQHNELQDIDGPPPRALCRFGQRGRAGIRLDGSNNIRNTTLYGNHCQGVPTPLEDGGKDTLRLCRSPEEGSCECGPTPQ
jgi:hypothetical protein